jgi:ABC-type nitrate/sulfonate/bicarbonate transport system substrate-binding protein
MRGRSRRAFASPAINVHVKSRGQDIRIIAGAAWHTQDILARAWLASGGLRITLGGGDAQVIPTDSPDQLALFRGRQIEAVWTVGASLLHNFGKSASRSNALHTVFEAAQCICG